MSTLRIAIQKSGRLYEESVDLLKAAGLKIDNGRQQLKAEVRGFSAEVFFLRNSDIPQYLEDGVADIGIVGSNLLEEYQNPLDSIESLGFSKCRVSLAVPRESSYQSVQDLAGKRIATSYPNTLRRFLEDQGVTADIHNISGSVEIAPNIGVADAICDIVSSGNTLFVNGLRETEVILRSEAVLVARPNLSTEIQDLLDQFLFRIRSVLRSRQYKYILLNAPNGQLERITNILPGMKSPTIIPLAEAGWSSVHSVIEEGRFWPIIDELRQAGAEGILITPIEKMAL
ncbi:ATP phosphoribosyltransferase [Cryomorphaceae bacterium]|nr:ATP phosphoribosyltransferase [Cryomorphaceae bacterium]